MADEDWSHLIDWQSSGALGVKVRLPTKALEATCSRSGVQREAES